MTYDEKLKMIAAAAYSSPPTVWLTEYLKLRGDGLLRQLRKANHDNFETIQGSLDENDRLDLLIKAIEEANLKPQE